jgi:hypothetical protein
MPKTFAENGWVISYMMHTLYIFYLKARFSSILLSVPVMRTNSILF